MIVCMKRAIPSLFSEDVSELASLLDHCYDDPDRFNDTVLSRPPYWSRQAEVADAVARYRDTVVYSGNAVGKDYLVAGLIPWWLFTRADSTVIVTGPSQRQLGAIVWKELELAAKSARIPLGASIGKGLRTSPLTFTVEPGWQALGFST